MDKRCQEVDRRCQRVDKMCQKFDKMHQKVDKRYQQLPESTKRKIIMMTTCWENWPNILGDWPDILLELVPRYWEKRLPGQA